MEENRDEIVTESNSTELLSALLSNPDTMSKIGSIISKFTDSANRDNSPPNQENLNIHENSKENEHQFLQNDSNNPPHINTAPNLDIVSKLPDLISLLSSQNSQISQQTKQQNTLLLASRPYLSEHRQQLIDSFIKFSRLGEILKKLS